MRGFGHDPWMVVVDQIKPNSQYSWRVRVFDDRDDWSEWSEPASFETGPFRLSDWSSDWVSVAALSTIFRSFAMDETVIRARLHLTGQGLIRASINGITVNADSSDPSRTDFVRALYRTFDVTDLLKQGSNALEFTVANGEWHRTEFDPRVLGELVLFFADGSRAAVGTGAGMSARSCEVTQQQPFYLELHDSTAPVSEHAPPRVIATVALPTSATQPPEEVAPDGSPPIRVVARYPCEERARAGVDRIFTVAQNIAGRSRVTLPNGAPRGTVITITHGENLDSTGRVDTTNLTLPSDLGRTRQVVGFVATGDPGQVLEAWFCYHGFAFLQVSGLTDGDVVDVQAWSLHSDLREVSTIATDEPLIGRLIQVARRTLLNNVHGIPEDCPTREQAGWTGDTASVTDFEFASFDMASFFAKWLGDLRTSQSADGAIPAIAPDLGNQRAPSDPVWGAAVHRVLLGHWFNYGDLRVVRENIEMLRGWVDFQLSCTDDDSVIGRSPTSYGHDWLALDQTPPVLMQTAATIESLGALIELEVAVGEMRNVATRQGQLDSLRAAAARRFIDMPSSAIGNGSQGSHAIALWAGLVDREAAGQVAERIESDVRARGNRLSSGFATTRTVVSMLAETGRSQVLFDALHQRAEPGIGAMLDHGPGTLWENWWIDPANTGTGSLDHVGLGGPFAGWVENYLAGIRPTSAGFSRFEFRPRFVDGINQLSYEKSTAQGVVFASYRRRGEAITLTLTVPVGARADIVLPNGRHSAGSGHHSFETYWSGDGPLPVVDSAPWAVPSWMSPASDVDRAPDWLARAIESGELSAPAGTIRIQNWLICMPVPHAQLRGPVATITSRAPLARLEFEYPLDLRAARFVYAGIDTCTGNSREPTAMRITVFSTDGSALTSRGHLWPAGWNRVAVDVGDWSGRVSVSAVEVAVEFAPATGESQGHPSFTLGAVGYSTNGRTW